MRQPVPLDKQGKKARKAWNAKQRLTWGGVHPSTKAFRDRTKFDKAERRKSKARLHDGSWR